MYFEDLVNLSPGRSGLTRLRKNLTMRDVNTWNPLRNV